MTISFRRAMQATFAALLVSMASLLPTTSAKAALVTYSTANSQLCIGASGCGVSSQTIGNVIISFAPTSQTVNATTFGSFGEITVACVGGGTACGSQSLAGLNLYINIAQTAPTAGSGSISGGTITGSISGNSSLAQIAWGGGSGPCCTINIGQIAYSIQNNPLNLVPPQSNSGVTSVQGLITDNTVPEPSTWMTMLAGFGMLGFTMRKRDHSRRIAIA